MPDHADASTRCRRCHEPLAGRKVAIVETEQDSHAIREWVMCSWACAREQTIRMVRAGRDEVQALGPYPGAEER